MIKIQNQCIGLVLNEIYMKEMGLDQSQLAELCGCSPRKINEIVNGKRAISPEFAIILEDVVFKRNTIFGRLDLELLNVFFWVCPFHLSGN